MGLSLETKQKQKVPATTVGQDGLEVDEVERPVADVVPLAQLQENGIRSLRSH